MFRKCLFCMVFVGKMCIERGIWVSGENFLQKNLAFLVYFLLTFPIYCDTIGLVKKDCESRD